MSAKSLRAIYQGAVRTYYLTQSTRWQRGPLARILVIDDDRDVRILMQRELEAAGHEVRSAPNGAEGLALQRAAPSQVVVTDIFMPEKEGLETIRELREQFPDVKVIAISGGGRMGTPTRRIAVVARELGVYEVLEKPFDAAVLLKSIDGALGAPSKR